MDRGKGRFGNGPLGRNKRFLSLGLTLCLLAGCLSACGRAVDRESSASSETSLPWESSPGKSVPEGPAPEGASPGAFSPEEGESPGEAEALAFLFAYENDREIWRTEYEYDIQGMLSAEQSYGTDGQPSHRREYSYDAQGRLTGEESHGEGAPEGRQEWVYDGTGMLSEKLWYRQGETTISQRETYIYDEGGNVLTKQSYGEDGDPADRVDYTYVFDESGKILTSEAHSAQGGVNRGTKYTYDDRGRVLTEGWYDLSEGTALVLQEDGIVQAPASPDGFTLIMWYAYSYDDRGRVTRVEQYRSDGTLGERREYVYRPLSECFTSGD